MAAALLFALLSAIALVTFHPVNSYPSGAPQQACRTLKPSHRGGIPQSVPEGSLKLVINEWVNGAWQEAQYYKPNRTYQGLLTFTTGVENEVTCKGFLIVARRNVTGELMNVVGAGFVRPRNRDAKYKLSNCFPHSSGITHTDNSIKERIEFEWIAPPASAGPIQFRFTCVQHLRFYYFDIEGPTLLPDPLAPTDVPIIPYTMTTSTPTPTDSGHTTRYSWAIMTLVVVLAAIFM